MPGLEDRIQGAVEAFWGTRRRQGENRRKEDTGSRSEVTGGQHVNEFAFLARDLLVENGVPQTSIFVRSKRTLPGFYRPTKSWDLLVVHKNVLLACLEAKSMVGSEGKNINNRMEEAIGLGVDIATAYREGAFCESPPPWVGYFMLLGDSDAVRTGGGGFQEPHFKVFDDFRDTTYEDRYVIGLRKLMREQVYTAAALLITSKGPPSPSYREPSEELSMRRFLTSLVGHTVTNFAIVEGASARR